MEIGKEIVGVGSMQRNTAISYTQANHPGKKSISHHQSIFGYVDSKIYGTNEKNRESRIFSTFD